MSIQVKIGFHLVICGIVGLEGFSYKDPDKEWVENYPTCGGVQQSPVDIKYDPRDEDIRIKDGILRWNNYDNIPDIMSIALTRHTIQVYPEWSSDSDRPYLSGGPLDGEYVIEQFHFHWGQNDTTGSEHTLNGRSTAMELHMVHWKREYGSIGEAMAEPDGLAVIGALYDPSYSSQSDDAIEKIWERLGNLEPEGDELELEPFPLSDFDIVNNQDLFASYSGSLTTPGCNEVATWLLAMGLFAATSDDMKKIRALELAHRDDHNNRPTQPLNGREITYYFSE